MVLINKNKIFLILKTWRTNVVLFGFTLLFSIAGCAQHEAKPENKRASVTAKKPFPQELNYKGCIKPDVSQDVLNKEVAAYYDYWEQKYLKALTSLPGGYYVYGHITGNPDGFKPLGSSEGMGYGMIVTVLMAGHDPDAKTYYDGLYKTFKAFHSKINPYLMGWVVADDKKAQGFFDSATDGDMDIAYSLLLADKQWGSDGRINYHQEAIQMIRKGLEKSYITTNLRLNLGDWDAKDTYETRPSDWMMDHMRAFYEATGDSIWLKVVHSLYKVYQDISKKYSSQTGLVSDFIIDNPPKPCPPDFLDESHVTNTYAYNACRVPLRIAMDYGLYGSKEAYNICTKMVNWIKQKTNGNPGNIVDGYKLDGTAYGSDPEAVFVAPFVAASVINPKNQQFLNKGWNFIKDKKSGYYSDTYNLLCMLFISGNWWNP